MYLFVGHDLWCPFHVSQFEKGGVMELGKLIPQIFFDILARWIPGLTVTVAWIILLGHSAWSNALNLVLAGHLGNNNALPAAAALIAIMAIFAGRYYIFIASFLAIPLLAQRGAKTEGTFQKTTRKFCKAAGINLGPADSAAQQSPSPR